jgi:hypothetical protein
MAAIPGAKGARSVFFQTGDGIRWPLVKSEGHSEFSQIVTHRFVLAANMVIILTGAEQVWFAPNRYGRRTEQVWLAPVSVSRPSLYRYGSRRSAYHGLIRIGAAIPSPASQQNEYTTPATPRQGPDLP